MEGKHNKRDQSYTRAKPDPLRCHHYCVLRATTAWT